MSFTGLTFLLVFLPITLLLYFVAGVNVRPCVGTNGFYGNFMFVDGN